MSSRRPAVQAAIGNRLFMQIRFAFPALGPAAGPGPTLHPDQVLPVLAGARSEIARRGTAGEAASVAAGRILSWDDVDLARFAARVAGGIAGPTPSPDGVETIYAAADAAAAEGAIGQAGIGLAALMDRSAARVFGLVGFAVCAARLGRYDDALTLAAESLRPAVGLPRAYCVAGFCEMKRGNRRAAQGYLSGASRIARGDPAHVDDLRMAQRLLLSMHMADGRPLAALAHVEPN